MTFDLRRVLSAVLLLVMGFLGVIQYLGILLVLIIQMGYVMSAHGGNLNLLTWVGQAIFIVYFLLSLVLGGWSTFKAWQACNQRHFRNSIGWALVPLMRSSPC